MTMGFLHGCPPPVDAFDVALLDLDGVVYVGDHAVPRAADALAVAASRGMRLGFVTNNASRTPDDVAEHLVGLGIPAAPIDVVTSAQAGARLLAEELPPGSAVLAVGGPGVSSSLVEAGLRPVLSTVEEPVAVLQGFGRDVGWRQLADASLVVRAGARWVATNLDATLPIPGGRAPGNGMLVAAVAEAAGRRPDAVAGKPHAPLMVESVERLSARRPLVVGDRLDTDIAGAEALDLPSMLVLTGVTDLPVLLAAPPGSRPRLVAADLRGLLEPHPGVDVDHEVTGATVWTAGSARARFDGGKAEVSIGPGESGWLDAVRCACAAAWTHPDADLTGALAVLEGTWPEGFARPARSRV